MSLTGIKDQDATMKIRVSILDSILQKSILARIENRVSTYFWTVLYQFLCHKDVCNDQVICIIQPFLTCRFVNKKGFHEEVDILNGRSGLVLHKFLAHNLHNLACNPVPKKGI